MNIIRRIGRLLKLLRRKRREPMPLEFVLGLEAKWLEDCAEKMRKDKEKKIDPWAKAWEDGYTGLPEGRGPRIEVDGKILAQAEPGETLELKNVIIKDGKITPKDE